MAKVPLIPPEWWEPPYQPSTYEGLVAMALGLNDYYNGHTIREEDLDRYNAELEKRAARNARRRQRRRERKLENQGPNRTQESGSTAS